MLKRKIYKRLEQHLSSKSDKMLIVDGARQIGKSYIIRTVGQDMFPNYIEINMEADKLGDKLFANVSTTEDFYLRLSTIAGEKMKERENTLVFIDEIQAYDNLLTLVKFLVQENRFTYIASGSQLGIALRSAQSLPVGSIQLEPMFPLDFEEFLWANNIGAEMIEHMRMCYNQHESLSEDLHRKVLDLFKKYLLVGGLPDAVNTYLSEHNLVRVRQVQSDIRSMYRQDAAKYESESSRKLKIQRIYDMIPSNLENKKKRVVAKDIEGKTGKRMSNYQDEFDYLISAGIALEVQAISKPSYPLIENSGKNLLKLYINDIGIYTGILYHNNIRPIMEDECSVNLGSVYEGIVAQELKAHGYRLHYFDNKKHGEVDYLVDDVDNLTVMPIEVKSGKDYTVHSALNHFLSVAEYGIKRAIVFNNNREVVKDDRTYYLPIYYSMFIQPSELEKADFIAI